MGLNPPDLTPAPAPADGEHPGGRFVVPSGQPGAGASGLARLLEAIAGRMPRREVEAVWVFPAVRREGREYGAAVVSRLAEGEGGGKGDRRRVYRARYVIQLKGEERGKALLELEETATAPAATLARVLEGVSRRADEAGDAELVDLASWRAAPGDATGTGSAPTSPASESNG